MKILAVDDNSGMLNAIRVGLMSYGYRVLTAPNAHEALTHLQEAKQNGRCVDLMITDLSIPGINGLELVDAAREMQPDLYLIIMTAYGDDPYVVRKMKSVTRFRLLGKPFRPEALHRLIEEIFKDLKRNEINHERKRLH